MTRKDALTVLVTGATGRQGGAIARSLLARGHTIRALTRNADGPAAAVLRTAGAQIVAGEWADRASLDRAMGGADAVFAMTTLEAGPSAETRQGIALVNAARTAHVRHFVYSSVAGADRGTGIPHFESKYRVEQHLAASDLPFTVLGPVHFMENVLSPSSLLGLRAGVLARGLPAERRMQQVAVGNLAAFAAVVLERRDPFLGRRVDVASDELTGSSEVDALSAITGRPIRYQQISVDQVRGTSQDLVQLYEWLGRSAYGADVAQLRRAYPEVGWLRFADWARMQTFDPAPAVPASASAGAAVPADA